MGEMIKHQCFSFTAAPTLPMQGNTLHWHETRELPSDGRAELRRAEPSGGRPPFPVQKPADALKELKELKQVTFTKHHHYPAASGRRVERDLSNSSAPDWSGVDAEEVGGGSGEVK